MGSVDEIGSSEAIDRAASILRGGGLVAFPTETVYGLGADAENPSAVSQIFELKRRPTSHPLIVHIAAASQLEAWTSAIDERALRLARGCWPGPLTLVLPRGPRIPHAVTGGLETVGLRVPAHPVALALLRAFGGAVAAPSANRFGRVSATTASHVRAEFGDLVPTILDGGPAEVGVESTIVDVSGPTIAILRPGGVTREQVSAIVGHDVPVLERSEVRVPGQLASHYAPRAQVVLTAKRDLAERVAQLHEDGRRVAVLAVGEVPPVDADVVFTAKTTAELAQRLYAVLRDFDSARCDVILASAPDPAGLGLAIGDRLKRAAGPRE